MAFLPPGSFFFHFQTIVARSQCERNQDPCRAAPIALRSIRATNPATTPVTRYEVAMRLKDKIAIVVGAGQSPGEGMGNGRATVLRFAQEGAKVLAVDNNLASAEETVAMARQSRRDCVAFEADVTKE